MKVVDVDIPGGRYPIRIGPGRIDHLDEAIPANTSAIALVTNATVDALYGERARQALLACGCPVIKIELPEGEVHKTWQTLMKVMDTLVSQEFDRHAVLVALGGGVIGDITGFAAAIYRRGIRVVQVPTTLLAQVDAAIGGKTGINHSMGKNLLGAFHQPVAVEIDTTVLASLPAREISAGLAEVIKYGMILDENFWCWCENHVGALCNRDEETLAQSIRASCEFKARIISQDERDIGLRAILNVGHTFGHAIEAGLGFGKWLHGEAVGCGLVQAAELSALEVGLPLAEVARIRRLVAAIGCPTVAPNFGGERWLALMRADKKVYAGKIHFVLIPRIGHTVMRPVADDTIRRVLACTVGNGATHYAHGARNQPNQSAAT